MRHTGWILIATVIVAFLTTADCWCEKPPSPVGLLVVQGKVLDSAGNPLSDADVLPYLNGKPFMPAVHGGEAHKELTTGRNGLSKSLGPASSLRK